jgi:energy-converting hydrogenase B subunit D
MLRETIVWALVAAGVALELLASLGVLLMRDALDRLHYGGPATLGAALLCAAVVAQGGWSLIGLRALLLALVLVVTAPLVVVGLSGTTTVLVRDPARQIVVAGIFGLALTLLFLAFEAPDVAISELTVSTVVIPAMVLLALSRLSGDGEES